MKIAIVGTGSMGSIYAAHFAEAGHEVWAIDVWSEHVAAIRAGGLTVAGPAGERRVGGLNASTDLRDAGACDLYVIATKASAVGSAARAVAAAMRRGSLVLTIQNGLGAAERIAEHMATDAVLLGVAEGFGAALAGPGRVRHAAMRRIRIGEIGGGITDRLRSIEALWRAAGFAVEAYADIDRLIWEKFICNVTMSAPCTALYATAAELRADAEGWAVALGCMREAYAVGRARGVDFSFDDPEAYVTEFARVLGDARPSMLLDHLAHRPAELDAINGAVSRLGREAGIATPYNDALVAVLRAREARFAAGFEGEA